MRPGLFDKERFDIVCLFQVLDHMPDPAALLDECLRILRPGGLVLVLNHNIEALSAAVLGERSPVIDIEHTFLYGIGTLSRLLEKRGFSVKESGSAVNRYSLNYLSRLLPLPGPLKRALSRFLDSSGLGLLPLSVPLGNMYLIAMKPRRDDEVGAAG